MAAAPLVELSGLQAFFLATGVFQECFGVLRRRSRRHVLFFVVEDVAFGDLFFSSELDLFVDVFVAVFELGFAFCFVLVVLHGLAHFIDLVDEALEAGLHSSRDQKRFRESRGIRGGGLRENGYGGKEEIMCKSEFLVVLGLEWSRDSLRDAARCGSTDKFLKAFA